MYMFVCIFKLINMIAPVHYRLQIVRPKTHMRSWPHQASATWHHNVVIVRTHTHTCKREREWEREGTVVVIQENHKMAKKAKWKCCPCSAILPFRYSFQALCNEPGNAEKERDRVFVPFNLICVKWNKLIPDPVLGPVYRQTVVIVVLSLGGLFPVAFSLSHTLTLTLSLSLS